MAECRTAREERNVNENTRRLFREQFKKTELCRYYPGCFRGAECNFAHGEDERIIAPDLVKTSLCKDWLKHQCPRKSEACQFAHGRTELRMTEAFASNRRASKDTTLPKKKSFTGVDSIPEAGMTARAESPPQKGCKDPMPPTPSKHRVDVGVKADAELRAGSMAAAPPANPKMASKPSEQVTTAVGSVAMGFSEAAPEPQSPAGGVAAAMPWLAQQQQMAAVSWPFMMPVMAPSLPTTLVLPPGSMMVPMWWSNEAETPSSSSVTPTMVTTPAAAAPVSPEEQKAWVSILRTYAPDHYEE
mmetsp:Transcript_74760/g.211499  ORF Transcript_74760/g.211499 Transcript_74760/m.211499 type:complete len:301 (-) Transcript_74760:179-1081(-)|eukprot:CAMPEP_0168484218 /NCGR_PEP_ID=MMETSP0228-20121227/65984_1 /TAXON_ID=133427 /ORGANISM="Protoceratium reticulatum, Strain CCCM 535 (=CCMP 1889)" /LENGTH=300 /DNA_ID=CAMNT_0008500751 /DNA_START=63 /DNA_END=965 /DNA_ORIENTATION=-